MTDQETSALTNTRHEATVEYLQAERIHYELLEHESVTSAAAEARAAHLPPAEVAKTVVLADGGGHVLVAIPATRRLDLHKLRGLLGADRRLRLCSEQEIARAFPTVEVGAVPPFGPVIPALEVIDRELLRAQSVLCPAGDHRHSVLVNPRDIVRLTGAEVGDISED